MSQHDPEKTNAAGPPSVLIVGGDGLIGKALARTLRASGYLVLSTTRRPELVAEDRPYLDLRHPTRAVGSFGSYKVDHAVLCGAITSIPACEQNPAQTRKVNVDGVTRVAKHLFDEGITLTFLSTSAVFDGTVASPTPIDTPSPDCEYGRQKLEAENQIAKMGKSFKIIRFTKVVNPDNSLFCHWIHQLKSGLKITAFTDAYVAPVSLEYCTTLIKCLLESNQSGIFHGAPASALTYFDVARYIAQELHIQPTNVRPLKNGASGVCVTRGAHLGGVSIEGDMPHPPCPLKAINDLLDLKGVSYV